ncbi:magnesium-dependent phosphatase-1 [Xylariaceae sp. FL0662B]|nr:magnesium-dependent phosphatase-1 [Xylariaceae sp. FL0662B]
MPPPPERYPGIVAFDLDGTLWNGWLNEHTIGINGRTSQQLEDNLDMKIGNREEMILRDRTNKHDKSIQCEVSSAVPNIIKDLREHGVTIAIVSRNTNKNLATRALWLINVEDPFDRIKKPLTDFLQYIEVEDVPKTTHFERIKDWSAIDYFDMILFDDKVENMDVELWQGTPGLYF